MTVPNENGYEHFWTDEHYIFYLTTFNNYSVGDARIYAVGKTVSALAFVTLSDGGYCPLKVPNVRSGNIFLVRKRRSLRSVEIFRSICFVGDS